MMTLIDIQNALDNEEINLRQLNSLVRRANIQERTGKAVYPAIALRYPFCAHKTDMNKTRKAKDETSYRVNCLCGHRSRHWTEEQAISAAQKHSRLSGWRR